MSWPLSEGVKRALKRAAILAGRDDVTANARHLLWALVNDESRAAEVLENHGITADTIAAALLEGASIRESSPEGPIGADETSAILDANIELQYLVHAAGGQLRRSNSSGELSSEHLLAALCIGPASTAEFLSERGVDRSAIEPREVPIGEPLAVDFEIAWEGEGRGSRVENSGPEELALNFACPSTLNPQPSTLRTIDAAANRAREGLRVIEDFTRFELNDAHLTAALKDCRHDLAAALAPVDSQSLLAMRDTPGDVGTRITTDAETRRESARDVARANFKRVQEAVRSLEEFGKTISTEIGARCEAVRYRLYTLEKAILTTAFNCDRLANCQLYLLLTHDLCRHDPEDVLRQSIHAGVDVIQLREKTMPDLEILAWAKRVRRIIDAANPQFAIRNPQSTIPQPSTLNPQPLLIINDRPDLAVLCRADGVHVGQDELNVAECRRIVGPDKLIGVSTHTIGQVRQAVLDGADYLGVGPVFPSGTKSFEEFPGLDFVGQVAAEITLPWFAIGGITPENIGDVYAAGATRVAVSGAICAADDPAESVAALKSVADAGFSRYIDEG